MFAGQLLAGSRLPDAGFERYGASPELITRIRATVRAWGEHLTDDHMSSPSGTMDS